MTYKIFKKKKEASADKDLAVSIHGGYRLYLGISVSSLFKDMHVQHVEVLIDEDNKKICLTPSDKENTGYKLYYNRKCYSLSIRAIARQLHLENKTEMPATWDDQKKIVEFSYK